MVMRCYDHCVAQIRFPRLSASPLTCLFYVVAPEFPWCSVRESVEGAWLNTWCTVNHQWVNLQISLIRHWCFSSLLSVSRSIFTASMELGVGYHVSWPYFPSARCLTIKIHLLYCFHLYFFFSPVKWYPRQEQAQWRQTTSSKWKVICVVLFFGKWATGYTQSALLNTSRPTVACIMRIASTFSVIKK